MDVKCFALKSADDKINQISGYIEDTNLTEVLEFGLDEYIDYDLQFNKSFIEPMSSVMGAIGWKTEHVSTLEDFFG